MDMKSIRIVLASPSDLMEERTLITNIVKNTDNRFKRQGVTLDLRRWEDTVPGASPIGGQGTIDDDLGIIDADVFICLYWKKVGTIIEELNETGTEHELNVAIQSYKETGKPDIKFFLKKVNDDEKDESYRSIEEIAEKIQPLALYKEFETLDELKEVIDEILLSEFFKKTNQKVISPINDEKRYIEAASEETLLASIESNKRIILHNKFYDILSTQVQSSNVFIEEVFDGNEIIIRDVSNFTLLGDQSKIITTPRYSTVLTFENCQNITLSNLTIGHTPHKGACIGAVLKFVNCNNIVLNNLELFGCGTYGLELQGTTNVTMNGCHIYECTNGAMYLSSSDLSLKNTTISDCRNLLGCLFELESSYISMSNVLISENETTNCIFALFDSNIYGEAISICNNTYGDLGWEKDNLYLYNNKQIGSFYATVRSTEKLSNDIYKSVLDHISIKSEIVRAIYEDGSFEIIFNAPDIRTINDYEVRYGNESKMEVVCG